MLTGEARHRLGALARLELRRIFQTQNEVMRVVENFWRDWTELTSDEQRRFEELANAIVLGYVSMLKDELGSG